VTRSLAGLRGGPHVLDGEVAVLDEIGRSDFERTHARSARRGFPAGADPVVYCAFDLLVHGGRDIRGEALEVRKALLAKLLARPLDAVLLVEGIAEQGVWFFSQVLALELEGMVAKRLDSPYLSGVRSGAWVKVKRPGAVPAERFKRV
jgi:bifunctional non-homologous end joining protein LigD